MSRPRLAVITLACVLPLLLALANFDYKVHYVVVDSDGNHRLAAMWDVEDPFVTGNFWFGCGASGCSWCKDCHTGGEDRQKKGYTLGKHLKEYYPRATLRLSEGQRLSWGPAGGYMTSVRGRFQYYRKDGTLDMIAPPGSLILKDRSGRPFMILMTERPELQPKGP